MPKTAYAHKQDDLRREAKERDRSRRNTGSRKQAAKIGVMCGARTRSGKPCRQAAGFGTPQLGFGPCKFHGGCLPSVIKSAASDSYRRLLGDPIEINPVEALLRCIAIRNGEITWLNQKIAELKEEDWVHDTIVGKQLNHWVKERNAAIQDLARFSHMAISLGIAERAVKIAEVYAQTIARLLQGIFSDLELTEEQRAKAPQIVRRHLIMIDGDISVEEPSRLALNA